MSHPKSKLLIAAEERITQLEDSISTLVTEKLQAEAEHSDFLGFIHSSLAEFPCCCEKGAHNSTPPMMWPELIACIVRRARQDGEAAVSDAAPTGDNKLRTAADVIRCIPESWRDAEVKIGNGMGRIEFLRRVSLSRNIVGRKIVIFHDGDFTPA